MSKHEIDIMWQKAMRQSIKDGEMFTRYHFAKLVAERALADPMREVQRLGQEIEQEPVAWMWDVDNGGGYTTRDVGLYQTSIPFAKHTPLYTHPPQRTEQNFCSRCGKRTPDLITIHTCTPPQENT